MKPTVIIVNGFPQSGKDTFCNFAADRFNTINYSTVDTIKKIARSMGWNGKKTPSNRDMLSALKDFYTQYFDGPYIEMIELIMQEVEANEELYGNRFYNDMTEFIFIHSREPEEIRRVVSFCEEKSVECYTVCIVRDELEGIQHNNHADANVQSMEYDAYLMNNSTLEDFGNVTHEFLDSAISGDLYKYLRQGE